MPLEFPRDICCVVVPGHSVVNEYLVFVLGKETAVHAIVGSIAGLKCRVKTIDPQLSFLSSVPESIDC